MFFLSLSLSVDESNIGPRSRNIFFCGFRCEITEGSRKKIEFQQLLRNKTEIKSKLISPSFVKRHYHVWELIVFELIADLRLSVVIAPLVNVAHKPEAVPHQIRACKKSPTAYCFILSIVFLLHLHDNKIEQSKLLNRWEVIAEKWEAM